MIKVTINNICAKLTECEPLLSGMIGKTLDVEFSAEWEGLSKTAVFTNGDKTIDVMESEWNGNTIKIPWEVLATPNRAVSFGIYGYTKSGDDIILAIPTLYTSLGRVYLGTNPDGDESTEPSLPVYAQLDLRVTELEEHGGGGTSDHRQLTNRDAANQHPISAITGLQSALDGKQPVGDYATTQELDALADIVDGKADAADIPSLDGYATESFVQNYHDDTKQDKLIAGANITIAEDGKTISAAGGGGGKPYHVGTNPPTNTNLLWINTSDEVEVSLVNGVLTFVGVDTITNIELVGEELRMR